MFVYVQQLTCFVLLALRRLEHVVHTECRDGCIERTLTASVYAA